MLNRRLISIVDDDQLFRGSMRKLVTLLGYPVEEFPSAADFLASHLLPETACLITDVHMPGMSGVELHGRLIKNWDTRFRRSSLPHTPMRSSGIGL
jgi:FixJ family two-component response regulator